MTVRNKDLEQIFKVLGNGYRHRIFDAEIDRKPDRSIEAVIHHFVTVSDETRMITSAVDPKVVGMGRT